MGYLETHLKNFHCPNLLTGGVFVTSHLEAHLQLGDFGCKAPAVSRSNPAYWLTLTIISFHFASSHFISFPISCHVPLDEMGQYFNVDQWEKKSEKESKKVEEDKVGIE